MPILNTEFKYFKSSFGVGLGAAIDLAAPIVDASLNNIFDNVSPSEANDGDVEYRCIYVRNENATIDLLSAVAYIDSNTTSSDTTIEIGLGTSGANGVEQTIPDEETAPGSVVFTSPADAASGLIMGTISASNGHYPIWIKRTVAATSNPLTSDQFTIAVQGETTQ